MAEICVAIDAFLDRITWLFHHNGIFQIEGHITFILEWLKKPHFFLVNNSAKSIGGKEVPAEILQRCLSRMQTWTALARDCLMAEFPDFGLISAFGVFHLPKSNNPSFELTRAQDMKLQRLSKVFRRPKLSIQFRHHWNYAMRAYINSSFTIDYWSAWRVGIETVSKVKQGHPQHDLCHVLMRGICFNPVTSGIEQSFTLIDAKYSTRRNHCFRSLNNRFPDCLKYGNI